MNDPQNPTPGGDGGQGGTGDGQQPANPAPASTEFEIDGQKYSADQIREAFRSHKDYQAFQPEFTRRSQLIAELVKKGIIDEKGNLVEKPAQPAAPGNPLANNPQAQQAVEILKGLGFITKDEAKALEEKLEALQQGFQTSNATTQLQSAVKVLSEKYSGKNGEPPFKLDDVRAALEKDPSLAVYVQGQNGEYLVDLEQTYRRVHSEFWDKLPEFKSKALKTERGSQVQTNTPSTRKKAETEEERTAQAVEFFRNASKQEE